MNELGLVQIYTGNGKGKTTSAIGSGIRAIGQGLTVFMMQFLKGGTAFPIYGEVRTLKNLTGFTVEQVGPFHFIKPGKTEDKDCKIIQHGIARAREVLTSGSYDLVILDEIIIVIYFKLVDVQEVITLLDHKAPHTEVILTGRGAPRQLIEYADLVSRIEEVKHPYTKGIEARQGIEY